MHHTGKKESKKKKKGHEKFAAWGLAPGPSEYVRTKSERHYLLDDLGKHWQIKYNRGEYSFSMVTDSFQGFFFFGFRVELNILLIEARRKAHSKPINILSGLVRAEKRLGNLWAIDLAATDWTVWSWPYNFLPAPKVSFHRSGKTLTQHCLSLFPLF